MKENSVFQKSNFWSFSFGTGHRTYALSLESLYLCTFLEKIYMYT
jgi:hypothetical protein